MYNTQESLQYTPFSSAVENPTPIAAPVVAEEIEPAVQIEEEPVREVEVEPEQE